MASFSTGGIGLNGHMGSTFSKIVEFPEKCRKLSENDPKWLKKNDPEGKSKIAS